jgi:hypothetical protein
MSNIAIKANDKKTKIMAYLKDELQTEGDIKNSALEMLKTGVLGVAGAGAGAVIGKPSLLLGLGVIMAGHYYKSNKLTAIGTGMLASGAYKAAKGVDGTEVAGLDGAKERLKAFGKDLKERLYIDKIKNIISKKKPEKENTGTDGLGEVQYFNPNNAIDNMAGLDAIEEEIQRHAEQFETKQFAGNEDDFSEEQTTQNY